MPISRNVEKANPDILKSNMLKDVAFLALTAIGGPTAHIGFFLKLFVEKRQIITKEELLELNALCQILPGPTSTQTLVAIAFKLGGAKLAYKVLFIWVLPGTVFLTLLAVFFQYSEVRGFNSSFFKFINPMIIGLVFYAGIQLTSRYFKNKLLIGIAIFSFLSTLLWRSPIVFPIALIIGGVLSHYFGKTKPIEKQSIKPIRWANFWLFASFLIVSAIVGGLTKSIPVLLFENTYRFGSMVFGGGYALIPMMYDQFVSNKGYLTSDEFLTGFSIAQSLPGPAFAFVSFANAMALSNWGLFGIILGGAIGMFGIFMPGTFLIFFVYPAWSQIKQIPAIFKSIKGVDAASSGFVLSAGFILFEPIGYSLLNICIATITAILVWKTKVPFVIWVIIGLILGFVF